MWGEKSGYRFGFLRSEGGESSGEKKDSNKQNEISGVIYEGSILGRETIENGHNGGVVHDNRTIELLGRNEN